MILFHDIFTGKDILTDSYKIRLIDDFVYEVEAIYQTREKEQFSDQMFGGNPSAEEGGEDNDDAASKVGFDVILNHAEIEEYPEEVTFKKFLKLLKKIISAAKEKIPKDRFETVFKPKMNEFFSTGVGKERFSNFQIFFSIESVDEKGDIKAAPIFLDADDTGMKAKMYYFKDLMEEEKC
jgi:hypothetical protein